MGVSPGQGYESDRRPESRFRGVALLEVGILEPLLLLILPFLPGKRDGGRHHEGEGNQTGRVQLDQGFDYR